MLYSLETRCIHGGGCRIEDPYRAISTPIYQTASFAHIKPGHNASGFDYTRESNPTRTELERTIASLEGASDAIAFSTGMAAAAACFELFRPGDRIVCSDDLYGGVVRLNSRVLEKRGVRVDYADTCLLSRDDFDTDSLFTPETRALYVETPSNPMMRVTDLRRAAEAAHRHGALLIVDNTFLSPYFQNPISLGADLVIHSGTKFLAGHNDTAAGFLCVAPGTAYQGEELAAFYRLTAKTTGAALAPFDSWLVLRGLKTLAVRMERQQATARILADWLKNRPEVEKVFYVGLPEHPGYAVNRSQSRGAGSMISFSVDSRETALKLLSGVRLITFAESLGGTESLLTYPAVQTHPDVPEEIRERLGITDRLLRLSVGLEAAEDLIEDLAAAMEGRHDI